MLGIYDFDAVYGTTDSLTRFNFPKFSWCIGSRGLCTIRFLLASELFGSAQLTLVYALFVRKRSQFVLSVHMTLLNVHALQRSRFKLLLTT
mmetsp:Transcript_65586/g.116185  ORF Transcript_65586/g.116185 Transcript_65586/m.116185 type:complete len:91 (-) Transcript_65586:190-462(-)